MSSVSKVAAEVSIVAPGGIPEQCSRQYTSCAANNNHLRKPLPPEVVDSCSSELHLKPCRSCPKGGAVSGDTSRISPWWSKAGQERWKSIMSVSGRADNRCNGQSPHQRCLQGSVQRPTLPNRVTVVVSLPILASNCQRLVRGTDVQSAMYSHFT